MGRGLLIGVGAAGLAIVGGIVWAHRRRRPVAFGSGSRSVGLAPPTPRRADRPEGYPFDPWAPPAVKERLARSFLDAKSKDVRDFAPKTLPPHVKPYAEFMRRAAKRPLTGRDVIKAYLLTVGSIQRGAICPVRDEKIGCAHDSIGSDPNTGRKRWPDHPFKRLGRRVRPEDALGVLLRTSAGQRYLDAASRGAYDQKAATLLARRFSGWGFENRFAEQLRDAPKLARDLPAIRTTLRRGSRADWYAYVRKNIPFVSTAKAGFLASMLGRGDMATADARELGFWLCPPGHWEIAKRSCRFPLAQAYDSVEDLVDDDFMDVFNDRMRQLDVKMPKQFAPFYEHLAHHALWDRIGGTQTTHAEVIEAMETA